MFLREHVENALHCGAKAMQHRGYLNCIFLFPLGQMLLSRSQMHYSSVSTHCTVVALMLNVVGTGNERSISRGTSSAGSILFLFY